MVALFYAGDGLLASTRADHLQQAFGSLTALFYRVVLQNNVINIISMICQICCSPGGHSVRV